RRSVRFELRISGGEHNPNNKCTLYLVLNRGRPSGGKVRHKRQALQDMARPLKQWLYKHRDNPYPTKTEKILLALGSQMTLVQVSNWFANARRRLKNAVRQPDLSWALRIKLYNKYVQGNAERLSVSSDDSCSEDTPQRTQSSPEELNKPMYQSVIKKEGSSMVGMAMGMGMAASLAEDYVSPPKYKSSLLHRYLNDSLHHIVVANAVMKPHLKGNHSGSFSSNEYEDELLSPSSSEAEANIVYRAGKEPHFLHSFPLRKVCPLESLGQSCVLQHNFGSISQLL
uniref:Mohawk homeobox a n=1 Tax=Amphilophus citrinellus TaxID=61819 RepID=A0A3Q0T0U7_AMPCI